MPDYTGNIFDSSIIHQQGFNLSDTITLTRRWLVRLAGSQDWTWTNNYSAANVTKAGNYGSNGISSAASLMFKPKDNMTLYGTFASSLQAPDIASAGANVNVALPAYRSKEGEFGYKVNWSKVNVSTAFFRIERPFANLNTADNLFEITGTQVVYGWESMMSGRVIHDLMLTGGITILSSRLTDTGITATDNMQMIGIPQYKSNILAEYRLPILSGTFLNVDWQHVGRRSIDDVNSEWTPAYNVFDLGVRYTTRVMGKVTTWRVTANNLTNVFYWSTIGTTAIGGQDSGSYLGHLGEPRLVTASMRFDF